jgi:FecR protein
MKQLKRYWLRWLLAVVVTIGLGMLSQIPRPAQAINPIWLEVRQIQGVVQRSGSIQRAARLGDRLSKVGDGIETALRSSSLLNLDSGIGSMQVAENTKLSLSEFSIAPDQSRITQIAVDRGQVRLRVRKFTSPLTRLELKTPSGVAAVRGTEFGVSVDAAEKLSAGTLSGRVEVTANKEAVSIAPGQGTFAMPGKAPVPPIVLDRKLDLTLIRVKRNPKTIWVEGTVHPLNSVRINGQWLATTETGSFVSEVILPKGVQTIVVSNPLGETRSFTLPTSKGNF